VRTIKLVVEYDGSTLCGWQRQANGPTVQEHLETALASLLQTPTPVIGASRTDAGVHARGQVAAFTTDKPIPLDGIRRGLNSLLPDAIAIAAAEEAPADFHPRFSATGKHYRYLVLARPDRSPRWAGRAWHRPVPLDLAAAAMAAAHLHGEHDFAAFRAAGCTAKTSLRRVDTIAITRLPDEPVVAFDVRGNAFLRHMVRIVVGTLIDVAEGRLAPAQVAEILASKDRTRAGQTAPAHGLELVRVFYDGRRPLPRPAM
jgi:tRNA pseudouridine38-40 synthase